MLVDVATRISDVLPLENLYYSAHIDPDGRFLYLANPKVGSTTILTVLYSLVLNDPSCMQWDTEEVHDGERSPLLSLTDFSKADRNHLLTSPDVFRFAFVRHPFSRLFSAYNNKIRQNERQKAGILRTLQYPVDNLAVEISF